MPGLFLESLLVISGALVTAAVVLTSCDRLL